MPHFINPSSESHPEKTPISQSQALFRESTRIVNKKDSLEAKMERVRSACSKKFSDQSNGEGPYTNNSYNSYAYVERTFDDAVIYRKGEKLYKAEYDWEGDEVVFDDPVEVQDSYVETRSKVTEAARKKTKTKMNPAKVIGKGGYKKEPISAGWKGSIGKPIPDAP